MPKTAKFEEVGRVQATDTDDIVVSRVISGEEFLGWNINKYRSSEGFTGFMKGLLVPVDCLADFIAILTKEQEGRTGGSS